MAGDADTTDNTVIIGIIVSIILTGLCILAFLSKDTSNKAEEVAMKRRVSDATKQALEELQKLQEEQRRGDAIAALMREESRSESTLSRSKQEFEAKLRRDLDNKEREERMAKYRNVILTDREKQRLEQVGERQFWDEKERELDKQRLQEQLLKEQERKEFDEKYKVTKVSIIK